MMDFCAEFPPSSQFLNDGGFLGDEVNLGNSTIGMFFFFTNSSTDFVVVLGK